MSFDFFSFFFLLKLRISERDGCGNLVGNDDNFEV